MGHVDFRSFITKFLRGAIFLPLIYFTDKVIMFVVFLLLIFWWFLKPSLPITNPLLKGIDLFFVLLHFFLIQFVLTWSSILNPLDDFFKSLLLLFLLTQLFKELFFFLYELICINPGCIFLLLRWCFADWMVLAWWHFVNALNLSLHLFSFFHVCHSLWHHFLLVHTPDTFLWSIIARRDCNLPLLDYYHWSYSWNPSFSTLKRFNWLWFAPA